MLACSIVTTRLDYCNSLLYGSSKKNLANLQRVQNSLARVVSQVPKLTHASPLLKSLHWLPITQRITFKMAVITYKVRQTSTPAYLHNLLIVQLDRCLFVRLINRSLLCVDAELSTGVEVSVLLHQKYGINYQPMFNYPKLVDFSENV